MKNVSDKCDNALIYENIEPAVFTAFRRSEMSEEEKKGFDHLFEMMMAAKQQILLRKALRHD